MPEIFIKERLQRQKNNADAGNTLKKGRLQIKCVTDY
jgi:hypothetical protein